MPAILYVIDAFTNRPFAGNPAAVCLLEGPADDDWMRLVAREMNLSETAFLHPVGDGWFLRWLTPTVEVRLCGHATLASAFVLWETGVLRADQAVTFETLSGKLSCRKSGDWIEMDFPATEVSECDVPAGLAESLGCELIAVNKAGEDFLVEVADEKAVRGLKPNFSLLEQVSCRGVIVTSRSESTEYNFVSRFFAPVAGINEDPVTGAAHCALGPYWMQQLGKRDFVAQQISERGGVVKVRMLEERVLLQGQAVLMSRVELF